MDIDDAAAAAIDYAGYTLVALCLLGFIAYWISKGIPIIKTSWEHGHHDQSYDAHAWTCYELVKLQR